MTHLKKLMLDNNQIKTLPHSLHKLAQTLTLLGLAGNPLEPELMQLFLAGLPLLMSHLKHTRPRRSASSARSAVTSANGAAFDLFTTMPLPHYANAGD